MNVILDDLDDLLSSDYEDDIKEMDNINNSTFESEKTEELI